MLVNDVKIIYCYDENKNVVYYNDVDKTKKYTCIDCGDELIVRDGDIKVKHLAHKSDTECNGTGESVFHKHWKEDLFKQGLYINVRGNDYEILEVHNEVSLRKYYQKDWDRDIIVDTLLVTTGGDVVVEIHYTNEKEWLSTVYYYKQLNLLETFEVKVSKTINSNMVWYKRTDLLKNELENIKVAEENRIKNENKSLPNKTTNTLNISDEDLVREAATIYPSDKFIQSICTQFFLKKEITEKQREALRNKIR